ncbi:TonB-dependent receptor [Ideonella sp. DXS22W]|uniref:TonB-dependent receptor n=1 Tax=Pseudaquabacterium inlustre TaxID=2984192 RepID=A0ABU9CIX8_9BURK
MFKQTVLTRSLLLAFGGSMALLGSASWAQETQRVEITGSAIKRIDAETAVPVSVIKMETLKAQGVTSIEQIMSSISAVQMTQSSSQQVGSGTGGAAFADVRGIGASKTLVLLNGRRVANNAIDGSAVDLNMIPFAALERVEVLRDGASSLYGTDAIGGVINFITRKDHSGGSITLGVDRPQGKGGNADTANVGFGFGDLSKNGFNVFGFIDVARTQPIAGNERPFNSRFPGGLSPTPFPANYYQDGSATGNPAAPNCNNPSYLVQSGDGTSCFISTSQFVDYTAKTERTSGMLRGSLALGGDHTLSLEWFGTQNKSTTRIAPVPYGTLWMNRTNADGSLNPYYPGNGTVANNITLDPNYTVANMNPRTGVVLRPGFIVVKWRALAGGQRTNISTNDQQRLLASLDGTFANWDYQVGLSYNENKIKEDVVGYSDGNAIAKAMADGLINPFGAQSAAGAAAIQAALLGGNLQNHKGKVTSVDGKASRELGDWLGSGRKVALAVGAEARHEDFLSASNPPVAEKLVASTGVDPTAVSAGKRNVTALFAELNIPVLKTLDLTLAGRYDNYSDFGSTTNPKIGLRFQPTKELLIRGSASTGFRAPSLYELNASQSYTNTGTVSDPVNCPNGKTAISGKSTALNCNVQFQRLTGGNTELKPEKSKNMTLGLVFEPTSNISVGADLWWVRLEDTIAALSETTVLGDVATFGKYIKRNSSGDLSIDGFSCPGSTCGYLDLRQQNLGGTNTNGVDLSANFKVGMGASGTLNMGLNSTYVAKYEYQDYAKGPWNQNVSVYVGTAPIFRWQHTATARWTMGNVVLGGAAHYKSGYLDQDPSNTVSAYATLDLYMNWKPMKGLDLTVGVNNVTNREPPYSNQGEVFQANYDPRFADPTGRKYYARASYSF